MKGETKPAFTKMGDTDRYSWLKAPRYDGHSMETGPLAQMLVAYGQNHKVIKPMVDHVLKTLGVGPEALFSTLGRTAARGHPDPGHCPADRRMAGRVRKKHRQRQADC